MRCYRRKSSAQNEVTATSNDNRYNIRAVNAANPTRSIYCEIPEDLNTTTTPDTYEHLAGELAFSTDYEHPYQEINLHTVN